MINEAVSGFHVCLSLDRADNEISFFDVPSALDNTFAAFKGVVGSQIDDAYNVVWQAERLNKTPVSASVCVTGTRFNISKPGQIEILDKT